MDIIQAVTKFYFKTLKFLLYSNTFSHTLFISTFSLNLTYLNYIENLLLLLLFNYLTQNAVKKQLFFNAYILFFFEGKKLKLFKKCFYTLHFLFFL